MTARRIKLILIIAGVVIAGVAFAAATQNWVTVTISGAPAPITSNASSSDPSLSPLALAQLALVGALALAGRVLRYVLGAIQAILGVIIIVTSANAIASPLDAANSAIAKATALSGSQSIAQLATDIQVTAWPWVALATGVLFVAVSVGVLVTGRRWPGSSSRYETPAPDRRSRTNTTVDDWDALSAGDDPTDTKA